MSQSPPKSLKREIGLFGAVMLGLGSIVGTGVFVSIGIAAGITGPSVVLAIFAAALVATCNAFSSAQLAASHPVSGGTYEYGYQYLTPGLGFVAGWTFLCAKSASAATAALGFGGYLVHFCGLGHQWIVWVAVATSITLTLIVLAGLRRSNEVNIVIVSLTMIALLSFILAGALTTQFSVESFTPFWKDGESGPVHGFLHATALMFVAYTGYGRIATLGEEVREPRRTIPKAIVLTLFISAALYIGVSVVCVTLVGATEFSQMTYSSAAPLELAAARFSTPVVGWIVSIGAMTAMLGVLLNLILGLSRVLLAMGRRGDMPQSVATLNAEQTSPVVAVVVMGTVITALTCIGNIATTWSFSAFTVLIYYAITNLAALRLRQSDRIYPVAFAWLGLTSCLFLAFWVDWKVWLVGLAVIAVGYIWHLLMRRRNQTV